MLIPFFYGWKKISAYPITLLLIVLQFAVYFYTASNQKQNLSKMEDLVKNPIFYNETSYAYSKWIGQHPESYNKSLHRISDLARDGSKSYRRVLSSFAIRDSQFRRNIANVENSSNKIGLITWQKLWQKLNAIESNMPLFNLGFKSGDPNLLNLFSYQFAHSGALHFLMNLFFFILLAPLAERILGKIRFLTFYLCGGVVAALTYAYLHPNTLTPLVGASGSISFLMAFVCMYLIYEKIYYFYWVLPKNGYFGFVKLSPVWAILLWLIADLSAELSAGVFGNIAHSAHLGGLALGLVVGKYYYLKHLRIGKYDIITRGEASA